jgi:hypothetical protein
MRCYTTSGTDADVQSALVAHGPVVAARAAGLNLGHDGEGNFRAFLLPNQPNGCARFRRIQPFWLR